MNKYYTNIWWLWFGLTAIYFFGFSMGLFNPGSLGYVIGFIGLFVPIGLFTGIALIFSYAGIIGLPILLIIIHQEHRFSKRSTLNDMQKLGLALLTLFIITTVIDFTYFHSWASWNSFIAGTIRP